MDAKQDLGKSIWQLHAEEAIGVKTVAGHTFVKTHQAVHLKLSHFVVRKLHIHKASF